MKITAILNGVKIRKDIPTHWGEVTFRQFVDLFSIGSDEIGILSYFCTIDKETLRRAKINNLDAVIRCLDFLKKEIDIVTIPSSISGYDLPDSLEFQTIGQYEDIKAEIAKLKEPKEIDLINLYPLLVGTYTMNPYDALKVDKFSEQFWQAPCGEVLAVGNFTLMRLGGLKSPTRTTRLLGVILKTKPMQAIQNWLRNLAFIVRYSSWKHRHNINDQSL